jgi:hypothetical protein
MKHIVPYGVSEWDILFDNDISVELKHVKYETTSIFGGADGERRIQVDIIHASLPVDLILTLLNNKVKQIRQKVVIQSLETSEQSTMENLFDVNTFEIEIIAATLSPADIRININKMI